MPSSIWIALLVAMVLILSVKAWRWLTGPSLILLTSPAKRREVLRMTLTNGARGSRVRFQTVRGPPVHIDFRKYFRGPNDVGLKAVLEAPRANASIVGTVRDAFERRGLPSVVVQDAHGRERIEVDIDTDTALAEAVAKCVFEEVLGLDLGRDVVGAYDLVLITNVPSLTGVDDGWST